MKVFVALCLLWFLVEVDSQTFPYISFLNETLANHSYVDLSLVGDDLAASNNVQCRTDLTACCTGVLHGDWYFPDGTRLPFLGFGDIFEAFMEQRVNLLRTNSATSPVGIYRCDIPTNAVHDNDDTSVRDAPVYVGLYTASGGDVSISGGVVLAVVSDLNGASPQFTLTCFSTGGPATTVTWTRDSTTVTEGTGTVLNDPMTAQYIHNVTVTGRLPGLYMCTVSNNKPSSDSATLTVEGGSPPTGLTASRSSSTTVEVSWTPPSPLGDTTGYIISYTNLLSEYNDTVSISGASTDNYMLTGVSSTAEYNISIVGTSQHLPSNSVSVLVPVVFVGQPSIESLSAIETAITLTWTVPNDSVVTDYVVTWERDTSMECPLYEDEGSINISTSALSYTTTITGLQEYSTYFITVTAVNSNTNTNTTSSVSTIETDEALPSAGPTNLTLTHVTATNVSFQWGPVPCIHRNGRIVSYIVIYSRPGDIDEEAVGVSSSSDRGGMFTISGLEVSATYNVRIGAVNLVLGASPDHTSGFVVLTHVEAPVLSVDNITSVSVDLQWTSSGQEEVTYQVVWQRDSSIGCPEEDNDSLTITDGSTGAQIAGLEEDSRYCFTVTASNTAGSSEVSNTVSAMTQEDVPSAGPTDVTLTNVTATSISFQWGPVPCIHRNGPIIGYIVIYSRPGDMEEEVEVSSSSDGGGMLTIAGLQASATYNVRIGAVNSALGASTHTSSFVVLTYVEAPVLSVDNITSVSVDLQWTSSGLEEVTYQVLWQRDSSIGCPEEDSDSLTITDGSTGVQIAGLEEDSRYSFTVTASNTAGSSEVSNTVSVMTQEDVPSAAPTLVTAVEVGLLKIRVVWGPVECIHRNGAITGYRVCHTNLDTLSKICSPSSGGTSLDISVSSGGLYGVQVAGINAVGEGPFSGPETIDVVAPVPGVPKDVQVVGPVAKREVKVQWSPPASPAPVIGYNLSCTPTPNPQPPTFSSPPETTFTLTGLAPDTDYSCSLVAFNNVGPGPSVTISFTTLQDYRSFQMQLSGLFMCPEWVSFSMSEKAQDIANTINQELETVCQCQLTGQEIWNGTLQCQSESPNFVIFSGVVSGTAEKESTVLLQDLDTWTATSPTIHVLGVVMGVGEQCTSVISDLSDDVCNKDCSCDASTATQPSTDPEANRGGSCNESETTSSSSLGLSVGVAVAVGLAVILVAGAAVLIPFCILKHRRSRMHSYLIKKEDMDTGFNMAYGMTVINKEAGLNSSSSHDYDTLKPPTLPPRMPAGEAEASYEISTPTNIRKMRAQRGSQMKDGLQEGEEERELYSQIPSNM